MEYKQIAVLLTCHNRKEKTLACLYSFFNANKLNDYVFDVYLVDDGSTDGTGDEIKKKFPNVHVIQGDGNLFWAGGMRLAWKTAIENEKYHAYLLLNDDVILDLDFINNLIETEKHALAENGKTGIYSCATIDPKTKKVTYGGYRIIRNHFIMRYRLIVPSDIPQQCDMTNANILWVSNETVEILGVLNDNFTHGIADFDYSLQANKKGIPVYLAPRFGGECVHDHGNPWKSNNILLKERIAYLKSPRGLVYNEYLFFIKKHFPLFLPYSFITLWLKTLFPLLWDKFKT